LTHVTDLSGDLTENGEANGASWSMDVHLRFMLFGIASAAVLPAAAALAESHDQDAARQAVESGEIRPLARGWRPAEQSFQRTIAANFQGQRLKEHSQTLKFWRGSPDLLPAETRDQKSRQTSPYRR
jgi:hypothetical protein